MLPTPCNDAGSQEGSKEKTFIFFFSKTSLYGSLTAVVWTIPRIVTLDTVVFLYKTFA